MSEAAPEIVYGAAGVAGLSAEELRNTLNVLRRHHVETLDTASVYAASETTLGQHEAPKQFVIHTKAPGLSPGTLSRQSILDGMEKSLNDLGVDAVDLYYVGFQTGYTSADD